ncbi:MAG TPA: YggT family protein [Anaerolineales bacterium]|nr:YggT family protein [Anaerolineales bacterium]
MIVIIIRIISLLADLLILLVIADAVLSFILPPDQPLRMAIGGIVNPLLAPIRRVVPLVGPLDLSPLILIIVIEILSFVLTSFLSAL